MRHRQTPIGRGQSLRGPVVVLIVLSLVWGYTWVVVKVALAHAAPLDFAMLRVGVAALVLFLLLRATGRPLKPTPFVPTLVMALTTTTAFSALTALAVVINGPGKTSVLVFIMPFWTLLLAWPVLGERLRGVQWLAVALAFAGLALIVEPWRLKGSWTGNLCAVLGGFGWAVSSVYAKRLAQDRPEIDLTSLTAWQTLLGTLPLVVLAFAVPGRPIDWSAEFIAALTFTAVVANAGGWLMWMYLIRRLPAGAAGMSSLAVPAIAVAGAWLQFGEAPSALELSGMLAIGVALGILAGAGVRRRAAPVPE